MITITRPVLKQCPWKNETDAGELEITLPEKAPELHELGREVDELAAKAISHEDFTRVLAARLPKDAVVVTRWHTGTWAVEVREGGAVSG